MVRGSCACGSYTYELPKAPDSLVVCHCHPCRKFAGLNGSVNALVPKAEYRILTGSTSAWVRPGDSGKNVENHYCAECSALVYVAAEGMPEMLIYKPGTLDDFSFEGVKPAAEIYTSRRPDCFSALQGVHQTEGAPEG